MTKYEVKAVVCDYGIFENGELKIVVNSQANALMIKYVLEQDLVHKVVINDLLEQKNKHKRKLRAMTNAEFCRKWRAKHNNRCFGKFECCPLYYAVGNMCCFSTTPFRLPNGKYILREAKQ